MQGVLHCMSCSLPASVVGCWQWQVAACVLQHCGKCKCYTWALSRKHGKCKLVYTGHLQAIQQKAYTISTNNQNGLQYTVRSSSNSNVQHLAKQFTFIRSQSYMPTIQLRGEKPLTVGRWYQQLNGRPHSQVWDHVFMLQCRFSNR